jgi:hypothetical protein
VSISISTHPKAHTSARRSTGRPREVLARHQLKHEKPPGTVLFDAVDGGDVGVVERGDQLGLALEALQALGVGCERLGQKFECDLAPQAGVAGLEYFAHPAGADARGNFIVGNGFSDHKLDLSVPGLGGPNYNRSAPLEKDQSHYAGRSAAEGLFALVAPRTGDIIRYIIGHVTYLGGLLCWKHCSVP